MKWIILGFTNNLEVTYAHFVHSIQRNLWPKAKGPLISSSPAKLCVLLVKLNVPLPTLTSFNLHSLTWVAVIIFNSNLTWMPLRCDKWNGCYCSCFRSRLLKAVTAAIQMFKKSSIFCRILHFLQFWPILSGYKSSKIFYFLRKSRILYVV